MSKATDIAKARILWERSKREKEQKTPPLEAQIYALRRAEELAGQAYAEALEANGRCGVCEKPKSECPGHIAYAAMERPYPICGVGITKNTADDCLPLQITEMRG